MQVTERVSALSVSKIPGSNVDGSERTQCLAMKKADIKENNRVGSTTREQKKKVQTPTMFVRVKAMVPCTLF